MSTRLALRVVVRGLHSTALNADDVPLVYQRLLNETYLPQQTDHNVLIIHPEVKQLTPSRGVTNTTQLVPGQPHQSSPDVKEAHALIDSLGGWNIVDTVSFKVKHSVRNNRPTFFTRGIWEEVTHTVERYHAERLPRDATLLNERINPDLSHPEYPVTAVFVNWPQLSTSQILRMSAAWRLPVYDRYREHSLHRTLLGISLKSLSNSITWAAVEQKIR